MVSTKRQIRRDDDRYGGFAGTGMTDYDIMNGESNYIGNSMLRTDTDYDITNAAAPAVDNSVNAAPIEAAAPVVMPQSVEVPAPVAPARPKKAEAPHTREDILPTVKTRSYATDKTEAGVQQPTVEEVENTVKPTRRGLSSRERIMLCVYVAIALILAVAVIATGVSISAASVQSDALATQIEQNSLVIAAQESELASLYDETNIRERAVDAGMVDAGEPAYNAPVADKVGYPEAAPHTNGFDEFLDWLSHVLN